MKTTRSFVVGFTISFITTISALYTYSYFFRVPKRQLEEDEEEFTEDTNKEFRRGEEKLVTEALLSFWEDNWIKKQSDNSNKKIEMLVKKFKEPVSTSLGRNLLGNIALTKLRELSYTNGDKDDMSLNVSLSDSWHIIDEEKEEEKEVKEGTRLTSDFRNGVRSAIGFAVSQIFGESLSLVRCVWLRSARITFILSYIIHSYHTWYSQKPEPRSNVGTYHRENHEKYVDSIDLRRRNATSKSIGIYERFN